MNTATLTLVTFDVAGSTHNQKILKSLMAEYGTSPIACELVTEPSNPYDTRAIAVARAGQVIGYVPSDDLDTWHNYIDAFGEGFTGELTLRDHGIVRASASISVGHRDNP